MNFFKKRYKELLVWVAYFLLLFSLAHDNWGTLQNGLEVSLFMVFVHAIIFYGNYYFLMPKFFAHQRYFQFFCLAGLFALGWFGLAYIVFSTAFQSGYWTHPTEFVSIGGFRRFDIEKGDLLWTARIGFGGVNVFFISIIAFVANQANIRKQQLWELKHEKINAEIKLLHMQINPHFLFNALNNIYSKAVLENSGVAASIHKLSGLLRYTLYDCDTNSIALTKEIEYIDNYIDLQGLKGDVLDAIEMTVDGDILKAYIAPMLLISFIENAFKHGNIGEGGWIKINLSAHKEGLTFSCENSVSDYQQVVDNASGIGLINVQKRLDLYYPNLHELTINKSENEFKIVLNITYDH